MKKFRDMQFPGLAEDGQPLSGEDAKAKVSALEAQMKMMGQQIQQMGMALEVDKAKQEATLLKSQMETAAKERMNTQDNQTALIIARLEAMQKAIEGTRDRRHERQQGDLDRAQDAALAAAGGTTATYSREGGQEREGEREGERSTTRSASSESSEESGTEQTEAN
jgi:hypothetical protein